MGSHYDGAADTTTVRLEAPITVDRQQLAQELMLAGLSPISGEQDGTTLTIVFDGRADPDLVNDVVAAHDPDTAQVDAVIAKARAVWDGTDTFTQAQAQKILAGLVLILAKRLR